MADFKLGFEKMLSNEGGYKLHHVAGDRGGLTFAGISANAHPQWPGWRLLKNHGVDGQQNPQVTELVYQFYRSHFWDKINGDMIASQKIAESVFDFSVNTGLYTAIKLAQDVVDAKSDGIVGPNTLSKLNHCNESFFVSHYALAKITRYAKIVSNNETQNKFLLGWINRTLQSLA
ncbi:N-acetylmuramidase [Moritella sp. 24]|uniref:glycoside hydrolase family 108 protein n=1 Tax=Moritella sp. 24 TaxID=2746230 RepID=UPI001BA63A36|nr:glycosyl hydrolase 108 family protein [Moritella sp. 24]QUM76082.1 N-acetylmuramidase [Moritella sp. 24]